MCVLHLEVLKHQRLERLGARDDHVARGGGVDLPQQAVRLVIVLQLTLEPTGRDGDRGV
jgi:hypothetical protein